MNAMPLPVPAAIELHLKARNREQVLEELVALLAAGGRIQRPGALLRALVEREALGSTGIGHGVAVPHCRSAEVAEAVLVLGRTEDGIAFDAIDGQPARLFFLLVAPESQPAEQGQLLARIARLVRDEATRLRLLRLDTPAQVQELLNAGGQ
jgi:mannitol/fructose-specific phosphotransferase system IIA component (Ntr-type)